MSRTNKQHMPVAAAAYLTRIKDAHDPPLTWKELGVRLGTSDSHLQRTFAGVQDTRGSEWFRIAAAIGASKVKLAALLADTKKSVTEGIADADWWLSLTSEEQALYESLMGSQQGRSQLLRAAARVLDSPHE